MEEDNKQPQEEQEQAVQERDLDAEIIDMMIECPHAFYIGKSVFYLYPSSLGRMLLLSRHIAELGINASMMAMSPEVESMRVAHEKTDEVCHVIALYTMQHKSDLFDVIKVNRRADFFRTNLNVEELAQLLLICLRSPDTAEYQKHLGIEEERKMMKKATDVAAKNDSSMAFGGKSMYGAVIDAALERYGWTYEYTMWGVSYANLKMLMADRITSVYLSKEDRKKVHIPKDRTKINADDINNAEQIKMMLNDNH